MLPSQGSAHDDALHRLGHVEPRAAHGRVERHHPMIKEPEHQVIRQMPRQIIQHQHDAQGGFATARPIAQPRLPTGTASFGGG